MSLSAQDESREHSRRPLHKSIDSDRVRVATGDVVTVELCLTPENDMVLEPLFDTSGTVSFVVGGGNYLPGLHELVEGMRIGDAVKSVSIDGGWGKRNPDLVIDVSKNNLKKMKNTENIVVGATLNLKGGIQVSVLKVSHDTITVDANHPMAGCGYSCDLKVLHVEPYPTQKLLYNDHLPKSGVSSHLEVASWAMGCFWGGELAFMRVPGVVGTRVGYTQGVKLNPTYEEVCQGITNHREAILVVYDSRFVSYEELAKIFLERLQATQNQYKIDLFQQDDDDASVQYSHGIYYHNDDQFEVAKTLVAQNKNKFNIELRMSTKFWEANENHQQYLLKGGQSARKGCNDAIRCFG